MPAAGDYKNNPPGVFFCPVAKAKGPGRFDLDYLKVWRLPLDFRLEGIEAPAPGPGK